MIDITYYRKNPALLEQMLIQRGLDGALAFMWLETDIIRRELLQQIETLRAQRKTAQNHEQAKKIKETLRKLEEEFEPIQIKWQRLLGNFPNTIAKDTPAGKEAVVLWEDEITKPRFKAQTHINLADKLLDIPKAVKLAGTRFAYLRGDLALLHQALRAYAIHEAIRAGFELIIPPVLANEKAMYGTGFFPHGKEQAYYLDKDDLYLVGTGEVPLVFLEANNKLTAPKKYVTVTPCFRREAGTAGKDLGGIFRVHQFDKVELVVHCAKDQAEEMHTNLLELEETILRGLGLPIRLVRIAAKDLGYTAYKAYDWEVFLPGQGKWREVATCTNCTDYQARRLGIKTQDGDYANTLNGTGLAIERIIIALLENFQTQDRKVILPEILHQFGCPKTLG